METSCELYSDVSKCHGIVHVHIVAHIPTFNNETICLVVRCAIFIPQRIWFKGEAGGISFFNFTENCEVGGPAMNHHPIIDTVVHQLQHLTVQDLLELIFEIIRELQHRDDVARNGNGAPDVDPSENRHDDGVSTDSEELSSDGVFTICHG